MRVMFRNRLISFALILSAAAAPAFAAEQNNADPSCRQAGDAADISPMAGEVGKALRDRLADCDGLEIAGHRLDRHSLDRFYATRGYRPLWVNAGGALNTLVTQLRKSDKDLLNPSVYAPDAIEERLGASDAADRAALDLMASHMFAQYVVDLHQGAVEAEMTFLTDDVAPREISYRAVLNRAAEAPSLQRFVAERRDLNPIYEGLREGLESLRRQRAETDVVTIPEGETLGEGERDERVPMLRQRLGLQPPKDPDKSDLYTVEIAEAVERFQKSRGLATDGLLGPNTRAMLNTTQRDRIRIARLNMERARWLPRDMGDRYIVVDIPGFHVRLFDGEQEVSAIRAIVGQDYNRTPPFADEAEYIQINPYWNVPNSILQEEIAPKILENPDYLAENNMEVLSGWGADARVLDPARVDWHAAARGETRIRVREKPGPENALGQVKFMFPNRHSIYLHDTPHKELFEKNRRTFSHGCIRVAEPLRLAEFLLQDNRDAGRDDVARLIEAGERERIDLEREVPVYITYFTAWPDGSGGIDFRPDVYGRDAELKDQMLN